jgi:hypothetical protein
MTSVAECVQGGKIRKIDAEAASRALRAGAHAITSLLVVHPDFLRGNREKVIHLLTDSMLAGLKAR